MVGDHMDSATSYVDPAIGAEYTYFGVSEAEARVEDVRDRVGRQWADE